MGEWGKNEWENLETGKRAKKACSPSGLKRFEEFQRKVTSTKN